MLLEEHLWCRLITITGLQLGSIIAFAIITESVFQWPGMGLLFIQAINEVDIPVMASYLMMIAFFFVTINLIVDLLYYCGGPAPARGQGGSPAVTGAKPHGHRSAPSEFARPSLMPAAASDALAALFSTAMSGTPSSARRSPSSPPW